MPKMKSHRGAAKRYRKTGSGRVKHQRMNKRHILTKKRSKRKRQLRNEGELTGSDRKRIEKLLPGL